MSPFIILIWLITLAKTEGPTSPPSDPLRYFAPYARDDIFVETHVVALAWEIFGYAVGYISRHIKIRSPTLKNEKGCCSYALCSLTGQPSILFVTISWPAGSITQILIGLNPLFLHAFIAKVAISSANARLRDFVVKRPLILVLSGYWILGGVGVKDDRGCCGVELKLRKLQVSAEWSWPIVMILVLSVRYIVVRTGDSTMTKV